ncbi:condensation domain-containing protein, partial [Streptomyces filipinensis]|uniref:condensation domain-containing protein n=1 Tax=Streptomyces filipinensis TaxID=66887 RepID=UPI0036E39259
MSTGDAPSNGQGKNELREKLLRRWLSGDRGARRSRMTRADRDQPLLLSFGQQQMWFLNQMAPDSPEYLVPLAARLRGPLDAEALRTALEGVVTRHEILRTRYVLSGEEPVQVVDAPRRLELPVVGLADVPADRRAERARELAEQEASVPLDLTRDWPVRAKLFQLDDTDHMLVVTFHHIACDAWSMGVFADELSSLYTAHTAGRTPELEPLPLQYADYAAWQRAELADETLEAELSYWREQLAALPVLELPTDHQRPALRDPSGAGVDFAIPAHLAERIGKLAKDSGVTRFVVLLTAFQILLSRYTGTTDIPVGTTVSGRNRPELQRLIGYGINVLVARAAWSGDPSFNELLAAGRGTILDAFEHQAVPFARLVDELQPERDLSRSPLYQADFILRERQGAGLELPGLDVEPVTGAAIVKSDLTLDVEDAREGALNARLIFATSLFARETAERMADHYVRLLDGLTAAPQARLSTVDLLSDTETDQLVRGWNATTGFPVSGGVHQAFAAQAARTPDQVAVVCGDRALTYAEVDERANRLAHHLRELGAGPEVLVGVSLERDLELIPTLLGVLKSGAAYLPLDPVNPDERLAHIAGDAGALAVITQTSLADRVGGFFDGDLVVIDDERDATAIAAQPSTEPVALGGSDHLIYVIYTSGSTGKPKGVSLTHANVLRLFASAQGRYGFGERDVWPLFHSYAFDVSVWEMWGALLHGGRLVVVPAAVTRSPEEFLDVLVASGATVLCQTPSAFRSLSALAGVGDARVGELVLRAVIFAGERLELSELRPWTDV